jgi:hypothetical protein
LAPTVFNEVLEILNHRPVFGHRVVGRCSLNGRLVSAFREDVAEPLPLVTASSIASHIAAEAFAHHGAIVAREDAGNAGDSRGEVASVILVVVVILLIVVVMMVTC